MSYPTYNFSQIPIHEIITEAYERCGLITDLTEGNKRKSALRSLNLLLSEWVNKGINLWTIEKAMMDINPGQSSYELPTGIVDIDFLTCAQTTRQLDGTAYSSAGGDAANAFDGNTSTACTQTAPDGYISYNYGSTQYAINYVGIQSEVNTTYTLTFEYSQDNVTWFPVMENGPQLFYKGIISWFVLPVSPNAYYWRVRETGGGTLNVQEIYFDLASISLLMRRISREDYWAAPQKTQQAALPSFYVQRTTTPILYLYPVPDDTYQYFIYTYIRQMPDVVNYTDTLGIPQRMLDAAIAGLAARVALKFFPEKYQLLKDVADEAYDIAASEDEERVPLRIQPNWVSYT